MVKKCIFIDCHRHHHYYNYMKEHNDDWKVFLKEAQQYHSTVKGSLKRPAVFTPEIIQNIAAMSIEKYFMAIFLYRGKLPRNHTMSDLVTEARSFLTIDPEVEQTLFYIDKLQKICSIDTFSITPPKKEDVPRFIDAVESLSQLAAKELAKQ